MKKNHKLWAIFALFLLLCGSACSDRTTTDTPKPVIKNPLDEIQLYDITVDMRPDGTMDITYDIIWKVLDSTSEGPLEWVKIGCPNSHVDEITALTRNIKKIGYLGEGKQSYIRVDFDRAYKANETIHFSYSIHQSWMYVLEDDAHICRYSFTPGWFDDIEVKKIVICWNSTNVLDSTASSENGGYLIWANSLAPGEHLNASVRYNLDTFTTNPNEQYVEGDDGGHVPLGVIIVIVVVVIVLLILFFSAIGGDGGDYDSGRGFGGGSTVIVHSHSSCVRSSCACASCACACACASGGRAGCSVKDFYGTDIQMEKLQQVLKFSDPL